MLSKVVNAGASGVNRVVAGVPGKVIRVFAWSLAAIGLDPVDAVNAKWQSSTGPADLTGLRPLTVAGPVWDMAMAGFRVASRDAYFETAAGDDLQLFLSAGVDVSGFLSYEIAPV